MHQYRIAYLDQVTCAVVMEQEMVTVFVADAMLQHSFILPCLRRDGLEHLDW